MLITQFNKLIRNKVVWTIFAFIVAFTFVGASLSSRGCRDAGDGDRRGLEGRVFGEDVSAREFAMARYYEMGLRFNRSLSPEQNAALRERTWARVAALRLAAQMGLGATEAEIMQALQQDPSFQVNGAFSAERYRQLLQNQLRIPPETYEQYLRQEITLRKLYDSVGAQAWTPPAEVNERIRNLTDLMSVAYITVSNTVQVTPADLTEDDARAYFEDHAAQFTIPPKIQVRYVEFPISNYLDRVTISEERVRDYYEDHIDAYTPPSTNGPAVPTPLEAVRDEVVAGLRGREAVFEARNAATDFAMQLATDRYGVAMTLDQAADQAGMAVHTSAFFSANETVDAVDAGLSFTRAAFDLDPDNPDGYFSDAVAGDDFVYVIATHRQQEARQPELAEVRDAVYEAAADAATQRQFSERVDQIRDQLAGATQSFVRAAQELGYTATTNAPFSMYEGYQQEDPMLERVAPAVLELDAGEVAEPLVLNGEAVIAAVIGRESGDLASAQLVRPQIQQMLSRYRAASVLDDWSRHLLSVAELEDFGATVLLPEEDEETGDDTAEATGGEAAE